VTAELVVGDIVTDILAVYSGPFAVDSDTTARIGLTGGGSAANTAAWLAFVGTPVHVVAVVGTDVAGTDRLAELIAAGVGVSAVRRTRDAPTGGVIVLAQDNVRTMLSDRGANHLLTASDVDTAFCTADGLRHLHLSGYTLLDDSSRAAGLHALRAAAERGLTTSVDAASAAPAPGRPGVPRLGPRRRLAAGQPRRGHALTESTMDAVTTARGLTTAVGEVIVKQGPGGAVWASRHGEVITELAPPTTVLDPTGAGDAFGGGLHCGLVGGSRSGDGASFGCRRGRPRGRPARRTTETKILVRRSAYLRTHIRRRCV
jgi:sugar/nucleoside kinase (ribokinase family)